MVILKELCGSKLRLVAVTAGNLTLRMRFELWCLSSLARWRAVHKHFMLGGEFFVLSAVLSLLKLQSTERAWTLLQNTLAGFRMWVLKFWRWWVCLICVFWDVMPRIFERNKLPPSWCCEMAVSKWRQQVPPTWRYLSAKQPSSTVLEPQIHKLLCTFDCVFKCEVCRGWFSSLIDVFKY